jgi:hypothetical protein
MRDFVQKTLFAGSMLYCCGMSQLLDQAVERLRELPQTNQDLAAVELMKFVDQFDRPQIQLSDDDLAELDRRLAEKNPKTLTMAELDARLKRRGI